MTKQEFIDKSINMHGDKYDYSLVYYLGNTKKVKILCRKHGVFEISPNSHIINKTGCSKCSSNRKITTAEFINISKEKYSEYNFSYEKTDYFNQKSSVTITCQKHGDFTVLANLHLYGNSHCNLCSSRIIWNFDYFQSESNKVHRNKYKYDRDSFKNSTTKTLIFCESHGEFWQSPELHLKRKSGCPVCRTSKGESTISNLLEKLKIEYIPQKIFDGCKHISDLKFDFYIPQLNICIEFNGRQHYESVKAFGGDTEFEKIKLRDSIKEKWCLDNDTNLVVIKYTDNIEEKIKEFLNGNN
jgi:lipid-A-disaccharide synthase-like uncharacterized protein